MKLVTFGKTYPPHSVGDQRLVPDALAEQLAAEGVLSASQPFGPPEVAPQKPRRPIGVRDSRLAR
jgi:hypothetical protein